MVPISVANSSSLAVLHRTVIMAVQIGILLLMVACVVLYTYYKRYVSEKDHEIARRDILFSIMAKIWMMCILCFRGETGENCM